MTEQMQPLPSSRGYYRRRGRYNVHGYRVEEPLAVTANFFLPTLLFALTINLGMAIQTGILVVELRELESAKAKLNVAVIDTIKQKDLLNKVIVACVKVGIEDAKTKLIIDALAQQGITMTTDVVITSKS